LPSPRIELRILAGYITYLFTYLVAYILTYVLTYSMEQRPWDASRFSASQETPSIFMEPEGSLLHSQVPATCPCPESDRSSPYHPNPLPENPS
jgi:hypothetical protein